MLANGQTLQPMGAASSQTRRTQPRAKRRYSRMTQCHEPLEGSNTPKWRGQREGPAVVSQDSPSRSAVAGGCSDSRLLSRPRESSRLGPRHRHRFDPIPGRAMKGAQQRMHVGSFCPPTPEQVRTRPRETEETRPCLGRYGCLDVRHQPRRAQIGCAAGCIDWYGLLPVRSRHHVPW